MNYETEFMLWFKGFRDAIGEHAPTQEQWQSVNEKLDGFLVAKVKERFEKERYEMEKAAEYEKMKMAQQIYTSPNYAGTPTWTTSPTTSISSAAGTQTFTRGIVSIK